MNYGGHEPQDAACPLKSFEACPVVVEPVEQFRMHRIGPLHPAFVIHLTRFFGELFRVSSVLLDERTDNNIARLQSLRIGQLLEKSPSNNLEALFRCGWPPRGLHALHYVLKADQCCLSPITANFILGCWNAHDQQSVINQLHRFAKCLSKCEMRIEVASRQITLVVELPGIGNPFIDEDQAGTELLEQDAQFIAGTDALFIGCPYNFVSLFLSQLPSKFAPEGPDNRSILLLVLCAWRDSVSHQDGALYVAGERDTHVGGDHFHSWK